MYTPLNESGGRERLTIIAGGQGSGRRSEGGHEVGDKVYVHPSYGGGSGKVTEVSDDGKYVTVKGKEGEDIHHFSDLSKKPFKVNAGAATVGRPKGVDGKKMSPRRTRMTSKEVEKIKTKGLKAGGPGSGRRSGGGPGAKPGTPNPPATSGSKVLKQHGFKYDNKLNAHTKVVGGTVHLISYGGGDSFEHYKGRASRGEGASEYHGEGTIADLHSYLTKNKI